MAERALLRQPILGDEDIARVLDRMAHDVADRFAADRDGPLHPVLRTACAIAFEGDGDPAAMASSMMEDAAVLVSSIKEVVEQK